MLPASRLGEATPEPPAPEAAPGPAPEPAPAAAGDGSMPVWQPILAGACSQRSRSRRSRACGAASQHWRVGAALPARAK
jgi:hypothetical protein